MITVSARRTLVALATTIALVPAAPALAQTAPDTTPPRLVSFDFTPQTVNAATGDVDVVVTARWTDDSGLSGTGPELVSFNSTNTSQSTGAFLYRVSGTPQDATYQGTATVRQGAAPGVWSATVFGPDDVVGNSVGFESLFNFPQNLNVVFDPTIPPTTPPVDVPVRPDTTPTPTPTPPPTTPVQVPTTIDVDAKVIEWGGVTTLGVFGRLGARVDLYGNGRLIRQSTLVAQEASEPDGSFFWDLRPGDTTRFHAVVDGKRTRDVLVRVRRTVSIGISQAAGFYTFTGTTRRGEAGLQVTVARLDAATKRVTGVASAVTNAAGNYTIRTNLPIGQAGYYALTAPTSSLDAGRSRLYGLIVPRPAPAPVARPVAAASRPVTAPRPVTQPVSQPADRNCSDFRTQREAQAFYNRYVGQFGDFARLDQGGRPGVVCESLP